MASVQEKLRGGATVLNLLSILKVAEYFWSGRSLNKNKLVRKSRLR